MKHYCTDKINTQTIQWVAMLAQSPHDTHDKKFAADGINRWLANLHANDIEPIGDFERALDFGTDGSLIRVSMLDLNTGKQAKMLWERQEDQALYA